MRVLHVFDHSVPLQSGYASRSLDILRAQRDLGWTTRQVTTPRHNANAPARELVEGLWFDRAGRVSVRTPGAREILEMRATAAKISRIASDWNPDAIYAHSPVLNAIPALRVARRLRLPFIYEVRAFWEDAAVSAGACAEGSLRYRASRRLETYVLKRADAVATICEGLKSDMLRRGVPAEKIFVFPNAVDLQRFHPTPSKDPELLDRLGLHDAAVIGFIGSFYQYEGLEVLIRAMKDIRARHPSARLLLVGGGPQEQALRSLASAEAEDVIFSGRVGQDEVQRYYSLLDACVFPRHNIRLTDLVTPLKPLEAMAMGKPVVASDIGGHRELMVPERTGILFPAGDVGALASAVSRLFTAPDLAETLCRNGREFVERERTWRAAGPRYVAMFRQLGLPGEGTGPHGVS